MPTAGFDACKKELMMSFEGATAPIANERKDIRRRLRALPDETRIAVESTGRFHLKLVEEAVKLGLQVYVVNPKEFSFYRRSLSYRVKSDSVDAELLARFVENEHARLHLYVPPAPRYAFAHAMISYRATLVRARVAAAESFAALPDQMRRELLADPLASLEAAIEELELRIHALMSQDEAYEKLRKVPGIGRLTAAALVCAFRRGIFASSDSFVAYLGLDLRVRESGRWKGRRSLSKRGDRTLRCLLYTAASAGVRTSAWKQFYERALLRGWKKIQSIVIVARKLARLAWSMMRHGSEFELHRLVRA